MLFYTGVDVYFKTDFSNCLFALHFLFFNCSSQQIMHANIGMKKYIEPPGCFSLSYVYIMWNLSYLMIDIEEQHLMRMQ